MIQRIQTVYLFLAALSAILFIVIPFGQVKTDTGVETWHIYQVMPIMIVAIITALSSLVTVFLFGNRKLQLKFALLDMFFGIVLLGLFLYGVTQHIGIQHYVFGIGAIFPLLVLLFLFLARIAINKDEKLVRSMDRLR